jgi:threonine/homoserine/homoserine lactone efflux protein
MQLIPNLLIIPIGIIIGILVAAPVGPVNVLCIQRAIERGFWGGIAAGLGAVLGDGVIALCAALGVGAISGAIEYHRASIQVVGGLALIGFGVKLYLSPPRLEALHPDIDAGATLRDYAWDIPQTFFLTITNPAGVLGLFAIFGGISTFVEVHSYVDALTMVASIVGGSLMWWIGLAHLIGRVRHRLDEQLLVRMNRVAGMLLMVFGVLLIGEIAIGLLPRG